MGIELIQKYFTDLDQLQVERFRSIGRLYPEWNSKINVISRRDIENLYERHILHSMAIAMVIRFKPGTSILDAGTGGGFPGIPLAILFPECRFHLVDSTAKKLTVVKSIASELGLSNVTVEHTRFEDHYRLYHFVVGRAVASLNLVYSQLRKNIAAQEFNDLKNGMLYLKGGDISHELEGLKNVKQYPVNQIYNEEYFDTKLVIHVF